MLCLKQPLILPFLCRKSATTSQIDSYKVLNSKLKPDLCNCLKLEMIESTAPPQQPHKRGIIFWDTLWKKKILKTSRTLCQTQSIFLKVLLLRPGEGGGWVINLGTGSSKRNSHGAETRCERREQRRGSVGLPRENFP